MTRSIICNDCIKKDDMDNPCKFYNYGIYVKLSSCTERCIE